MSVSGTSIRFSKIRELFGVRDNTNRIYMSDYMPGGKLSSNIDFSQDEEGGVKKMKILRGKEEMKIYKYNT